jgi:lipid-A-disaccharide synthase-like uncharacterized protein
MVRVIGSAGRKLITLRDAAQYITKLPKAEHDAPELFWPAAVMLRVGRDVGQFITQAGKESQ